jgi:hypothetical protein
MSKPKITDSLEFPSNLKATQAFLWLGVVGLLATVVGYFMDHDQFFHSYLTSFTYFSSIALGALFFVMIQHVTRASYSVIFRRIAETFSANIWIWGIFFIPILMGMHSIYHWTHAEAVAHDPVLQGKEPYLNTTFFIVRQVIYFAIWGFLGRRLYKNSVKMDETGDWGLQTLLRLTSGPGIFIFAITLAFASFDWIMSVDPHWYSTIFGVYYFAMSFQLFFAIMMLITFYFKGNGVLDNVIGDANIYDMSVQLFGFTIFYTYIAFSQFLLIYYANIPEETVWFNHRLMDGWQYLAWFVLAARFVIPFIMLIGKRLKTNRAVVTFVTTLIVIAHFVEIYWLIAPNFSEHGIHFSWMDITAFIGLGGVFFGLFFRQLKQNKLIPTNDPKLEECLNKH